MLFVEIEGREVNLENIDVIEPDRNKRGKTIIRFSGGSEFSTSWSVANIKAAIEREKAKQIPKPQPAPTTPKSGGSRAKTGS